jgi:plastocyanin
VRGVAAVAAATCVLLAAPAALADPPPDLVSIKGIQFTPSTVTALVGETVHWSNESGLTHTVTSPDGNFDSGDLGPGDSYDHGFARAGRFRYICTIHAGMSGVVQVVPIALSGPVTPVRAGQPVRLEGREPAGGGAVTIQRTGPGPATTAVTVDPTSDGTFSAELRPSASGSYRAVAGGRVSPEVRVGVVTQVRLRARFGARHSTFAAGPLPRGAVAVLQTYSLEHYRWVTRARARPGRGGMARFGLMGGAGRRPTRALAVTRAGVLAASEVVRPHAARGRHHATVMNPGSQPMGGMQ